MNLMNVKRIKQVLTFGWLHAGQISQEHYDGKRRLAIYADILMCYIRYTIWSNQYLNEALYSKSAEEKRIIGEKYKLKNTQREQWLKQYIENSRFLIKYSRLELESSMAKHNMRSKVYAKHYHTGVRLCVEYGVMLTTQHYQTGNLVIKDDVLLGRGSDIDYTGDLIIGKGVSISEGVKILTHTHDLEAKFHNGGIRYDEQDLGHGCIPTSLKIDDYAWIGAKAMIMPGVMEIGRGAVVAANTVVTQKIPPYAIVQGMPAKIIGFRCNPMVAAEFERNNYPPEERIPLEELKNNYQMYFGKESRAAIRQSMRLSYN